MDIKIDDENIDVKKIMEQIKANIANRPIKNDLLNQSFPQQSLVNINANFSQLERHEYMLNRAWNYSADIPISSHRKFFGKFIVLGKKIIRKLLRWYINPIVIKQVEFNAEVVRSVNATISTLKEMEIFKQELESNKTQIEASKRKLDSLIDDFTKVNELYSRESLEEKIKSTINLDIIHEQIAMILIDIETLGTTQSKDFSYDEINIIKQKLNEIEIKISSNNSQNQDIYHTTRVATERLRRIERTLKQKYETTFDELTSRTSITSNVIINEKETDSDFDYFLFEEIYRGSRDTIKERQQIYLQYFKENDYVLDLGCGRGEFTELLIENNINVTAVDINEEMILYCKDRGFPIVNSGAIEFLNSLEDNSVNGIFLGQVIEHLEPRDFIALVNVAYKKLKTSGVFIAETPNPQCLSVFAQSFYMDITHIKPVHPYTSKFILESAGFREVNISYISPNDEELRLPELKIDGINNQSIDQFNKTIRHWNNVIFGYQDYYVLGRK